MSAAGEHAAVAGAEIATPVGHGRRRGWLVRRALLLADMVGLVTAFVLAQTLYRAESAFGGFDRVDVRSEYLIFGLSLPLWVLLAKAYRLYANDEERADHSTVDEVTAIFHLVTVGTFAVLVTSWWTGVASPQPQKLFAFWLLAIVLVGGGRAAARAVCRRRPAYLQNVVIVGCGHVGQTVARKLLNHPEYGAHVVGFIDAEPRDRTALVRHLPVLGTPEALPRLVEQLKIDRVVIAFSSESHDATIALLRSLKDTDVQIDVVPRLFELITPSTQMHQVEGLPLLSLPPTRLSRSDRFVKRLVDIVGAVVGLVLLAPLALVIAVAIKLDSPGPVFFRQERVGEHGRRFRMWKFRSMVSDAERRQAELQDRNVYVMRDGSATMFKVNGDPRVTRVGWMLRRHSVDEMPQLVNVLRGEMSLVGPRPLVPGEILPMAGTWHSSRLTLRPGMTGLWQVSGRNDIPFDEMMQLDYRYVTNWSLLSDITVLFRTVTVVLCPSASSR